jgi:CDP-glucose 4,6-dehydratase
MKFLVTGHTGFKGSWLVLLLRALGHQVDGVSLKPQSESLFVKASLERLCETSSYIDIRNKGDFQNYILHSNADVVVHLAAQSLVRESYRDPVGTFETNFNGTLNLLEMLNKNHNFRSCIIVTTDKVYLNTGKRDGYSEGDPLGGRDPYSASKAAADILTQAWRASTSSSSIPINIVRAGNVIGGGDWSDNRIIPDLVRSIQSNQPAVIRNPQSVRPWQHVLDCLTGYLALVDNPIAYSLNGEWNFGPELGQNLTVQNMADIFLGQFENTTPWKLDSEVGPKESDYLTLDSTKARTTLDWKDLLPLEKGIVWTAEWYKSYLRGENSQLISASQIERYLKLK